MKLKDIVAIIGGVLHGDPEYEILSVNSISEATSSDITFAEDIKLATSTQAGCIVATDVIKDRNTIVVKNPKEAFSKLLKYIDEELKKDVDFSYNIHPTAKMGKNVKIGVMSFIGKNSLIGDETTIYPFVYIGMNVEIGSNCVIYPNVTILDRVKIGNNCIIHSGAVIGADGFGY
ncbi:MAG: UDP-3-O-(3-hydroxymyristoyl)glucosamine N-acyltransferase, partial [bacterium]|nr:UDP-3-O-(3-hydroxymyristoyl)glucosamine N-acyltransferase [bacterium]